VLFLCLQEDNVRNWTIGKRLVTGFAVVLAITVALGGFAAQRIMTIRDRAASITQDAMPGIINIDEVMRTALVNDAVLLHHIASEDDKRMAALEKELADNASLTNAALKRYEATIQQPKDRELFEAIGTTRQAMSKIRTERVLPLSRAHKSAQALEAFEKELAPADDAYMKAMQAEVDFNRTNGENFAKEISSVVTGSLWIVSLGLLAAVAFGVSVSWYITATTNGTLRASLTELTEGAEQVVSASGQVATSAQSLSQGATEQAASLEETSASMEEMASMTRKNAENSQTAAGLMGEVDTRVRESNQALTDMVASMASIQESSKQVAKIIKTIDEIAFQTNILALNAAVEAARAGEAGMGFAVVADEVRNLAQRSAQAAKDTAGLIEASIAKAQSGNQKVEQVASSISGITESVTKVKGLVDEVSLASRQQTQGIDQVSQAIAQMEKVTQTTAATAEESAAASEELNAQAEASMGIVAQLEQLVGGKGLKAPAAIAVKQSHRARKSNVVSMPQPQRTAPAAFSADDELPMGDTGTYGKF
jgi:methyl-accepting chemotaxis protein